MRNIEIKAKVNNLQDLIERVKCLTTSEPEIIKQVDIFFNQPRGRLKLRKFENGTGELIYYNRPDTEGPKLCSYEKCDINAECLDQLNKVLTTSLGIRGVVKKERKLFLIDQTRVHIDTVENLGNFMELEVVLTPDHSIEDGKKIADDLMKKLNISNENLLASAYIDLLEKLPVLLS